MKTCFRVTAVAALLAFCMIAGGLQGKAQAAGLEFKDLSKEVDQKDKTLKDAIQKVVVTSALKGYDTSLKMTDNSYNGDTEFAEATLFAGNEYFFSAVGGENAQALMVEIMDQAGNAVNPKTGKILPKGTKASPTDTVIVRPEWTGSFLIQVTVFCKTEYEGANWALISGYKVKK